MTKFGSRRNTNHVTIIALTIIVAIMFCFGMIKPSSFAEAAEVASEQQQMEGRGDTINQERTDSTEKSDGVADGGGVGDGDGDIDPVVPGVADTTTMGDDNNNNKADAVSKETFKENDKLSDDIQPATNENEQQSVMEEKGKEQEPYQEGPFIDLLGTHLVSLEKVDDTHVKIRRNYTTDALRGKKVIGLYFSADWCGPCRAFTPELVSFYDKINSRRGRYKGSFEIVWISRCRDMNGFSQYFTKMGDWYALPAEEAMSNRGMMLSEKYKVKGIPHFVLLDEIGNVITLDGRNKIPQDRAGIGFPWRNPISTLYMNLLPRSVRMMIKTNIENLTKKLLMKVQSVFSFKSRKVAS